ncbi:unnamed protein product [Heterobilharzia americana]|nr:unnamed protein product [Heterobilharzia americana]
MKSFVTFFSFYTFLIGNFNNNNCYNQYNNVEKIDSCTQSDVNWFVEKSLSKVNTNVSTSTRNENCDHEAKYENALRQKHLELEEIRINYNKLLEGFMRSQTNFEQIQTELQSQLNRERMEKEKLILKTEEIRTNFNYELQTLKQRYENIRTKQRTEFTLAQNILKSKIHELHQRLLGCYCEPLKVNGGKLSEGNQLLPEISVSIKQASIPDNVSLSTSSSSPSATVLAVSEPKSISATSSTHECSQPRQRSEQHLYMNGKCQDGFHLPALST